MSDTYYKWYKVVFWWELRRIFYNMIIFLIGWLSFYIAFVTIPLVYGVIGFILNVVYSFTWIMELLLSHRFDSRNRAKYRKYALIIYTCLSAFIILCFALYIKL